MFWPIFALSSHKVTHCKILFCLAGNTIRTQGGRWNRSAWAAPQILHQQESGHHSCTGGTVGFCDTVLLGGVTYSFINKYLLRGCMLQYSLYFLKLVVNTIKLKTLQKASCCCYYCHYPCDTAFPCAYPVTILLIEWPNYSGFLALHMGIVM